MTTAAALELLLALLNQSQSISALIQKANAENRTTLSPEEWRLIVDEGARARAKLVAAIGE